MLKTVDELPRRTGQARAGARRRGLHIVLHFKGQTPERTASQTPTLRRSARRACCVFCTRCRCLACCCRAVRVYTFPLLLRSIAASSPEAAARTFVGSRSGICFNLVCLCFSLFWRAARHFPCRDLCTLCARRGCQPSSLWLLRAVPARGCLYGAAVWRHLLGAQHHRARVALALLDVLSRHAIVATKRPSFARRNL